MFPGMLLTYFLNDFEMVPVAPIITGITLIIIIINFTTSDSHHPNLTFTVDIP
jgi:hypothetical protein